MDNIHIEDEIAVYEFKARWCDEHGFPGDAAEHRAYLAQLRRRASSSVAAADDERGTRPSKPSGMET